MECKLDFLINIYSVLQRYRDAEVKSGSNISIIQITGKDHDEVVICRLLAFLLNPRERHGQDTKFLNLFLSEIGEDSIQDDEIFTIGTEFPTNEGRRIDIVLKSNKRFLPFEVKIYAGDQKEQCTHYYTFSHDKFNANKVYYLTPYEHAPDESSIGDLRIGETLRLISFSGHILNWLEKCEKDNNIYSPILREFIRELKFAIRKFCGLSENKEMNEELLEEIIGNNENFDAAKAIYAVGKEIRPDVLWEAFCKQIEPKALGDWHQFNYGEVYDSNNALTVSIDKYGKTILIHFFELFSYVVVDVENDIALARAIQVGLKNKYQEFNYEEATTTGFAINNTQNYFMRGLTDNPFDLYKAFFKEKVSMLEEMQNFIKTIYEIS